VLTFTCHPRASRFPRLSINTASANLRHCDLGAACRALAAARHISLAKVSKPCEKKAVNAEDFRASRAEKAPREALSAPLAAGRAE